MMIRSRRDNADGDELVSLLHILHDVISEGVELPIRNARVAIAARELIPFLLNAVALT